MFGFLQPRRGDVTYRQLYAGCCAFQHRQFGIETLPLLSYEAVFLYALAVDLGCCELPDEQDATCCRLRKQASRLHAVDPRVAEFCASFGVLLASIKLEDDVRDDRSLLARFALWRLGSRVERAKDYFTQLDAEFRPRVGLALQQHLELERAAHAPSLEAYSEPTAAAFGYVFELFARVLPAELASAAELQSIGRAVGRAIICFDCAVDYRRDRRLGRYNPLTSTTECRDALVESQRSLSQTLWTSVDLSDSSWLAAGVAADTFDRVGRYQNVVSKEEAPRSGRKMHPRQGDCDVPCDVGPCDAACCDGCGGGDAADGSFCLVDCCGGCYPGCITRRERNKVSSRQRERRRPQRDFAGKTGATVGPLNPSGVVRIDGEDMPARCESGWVDADTEVRVIRKESFGVVVRQVEPEDDQKKNRH
ncbi:DUF5685 family protein [Aeoliella sp.]|uniref:DUF5685 family protein n=1 Tax=Aeoliella sp. TaxID=2795800 RepID=UPI003CCBC750